MFKARKLADCGDQHNDLFRPGPNWKLNACVGWNGRPADFYRMAAGFFEAGKRLVDSLAEDSLLRAAQYFPHFSLGAIPCHSQSAGPRK